MESLSELQNPLLPRSPTQLHSPYPYPEASPAWPCREKIYSYLLGGAGPAHAHQLLDPGSLQLAVEALEQEKQGLQSQIAQVLEGRQQLAHLKMSLSLEVATYR